MLDKETKIHSLGPKKMSSTGKGFFTASTPNGFYQNKPLLPVVTVPQPQIRYLLVQHPQFDTLVKELTLLRKKYDELLVKFDQKCTQQSLRENIQQVIESTHDIEAKMSRIVEDANQVVSNSSQQQKENLPTVETEKARHEKECLQIIETVNRATEKIEELEGKNANLQEEISKQREWKEALEAENKRLRLMVQNIEHEKQQEIERLRQELSELKKSQEPQNNLLKSEYKQGSPQVQQEKLLTKSNVKSMKNSKKITNMQYLTEDANEMENDISGFSRLTINGQASRVSRVYQ